MEELKLEEAGWKTNLGAGALALGLATGAYNAQTSTLTPTSHHQSHIASNKPDLGSKKAIDVTKLMVAIKAVESSGGVNHKPRHEPKVEHHLRETFRKLTPNLQNAIKKYGFSKVASSYGDYQVMASTAYEMGFQGSPEQLAEPSTNLKYATKLVEKAIHSHKTHSIEDVISAYNAGLGNIGHNHKYVQSVMRNYK